MPRITLGDLIMQKVNERKTELLSQFSDNTEITK